MNRQTKYHHLGGVYWKRGLIRGGAKEGYLLEGAFIGARRLLNYIGRGIDMNSRMCRFFPYTPLYFVCAVLFRIHATMMNYKGLNDKILLNE